MNKTFVDFPPDYAEIESQMDELERARPDSPGLATVRVQVQRKKLDNYEAKMRSHAERCVAGR